ncbi:BNR-4 repeat-containing protein [Membranihabitans maritimus]|uniref:BNR-4 repeat-containing protein n=1 Tax=Membranihabitans maritimus TaxID=2904244 RepID=UPI001F2F8B3F|nr:BNR-4 repeat-containing protein [Membranihabitans maritimus]
MNNLLYLLSAISFLSIVQCTSQKKDSREQSVTNKEAVHPDLVKNEGILHNTKLDGYRGIWYMNQPLENEYKFKYSGGLGTYCAKHNPFAIYRPEVNKTFFCYGGTDPENSTLLHMVSYYDHTTGKVPRPTLLLDKQTTDAHDNPVISIDEEGYIYIFSTSHGTSRPSYIHRSKEPYDINFFEKIEANKLEEDKRVPMTNFSYMQSWYLPGNGFVNFFTRYNYPAARTICFMTSPDGENWSEWKRIAAIKKGHYQISAIGQDIAGSAFNFHPDTQEKNGLNWRTNLYYVETSDFGKTWQSADGTKLKLPLTEIENPALIYDYYNEGLNVYMKDITYDQENHPVILYITSKGFEAGPKNDPRTWRTARWNGEEWIIRDITTSDNNYDMGSLYIEKDGTWKIIAPTETGPQPYNPGGEVALWESKDQGNSWSRIKQMTKNSSFNHSYVRRPLNAHPDFYGFWADGHGRQKSKSRLYISNKNGDVFMLPPVMENKAEKPVKIQ